MRTSTLVTTVATTPTSRFLFPPTKAIEKWLCGSRRCLVILSLGRQQMKLAAELGVERIGRIANDRQPTTASRTVFGECCHQYITAHFDRSQNLIDIRSTILGFREEMEYGSVVPIVIRIRLQLCVSHIALQPGYLVRA